MKAPETPLAEKEILDLCESIHGWMHRDELRFLYGFARRLPENGQWVEVGVWKGRSLFAVAMGANLGSTLVGVDTFAGTGSSEAHGEARISGWVERNAFLVLELSRALRGEEVTFQLHKQESINYAKNVDDASLDVVFLDADHEMRAVEADIRTWWPKLKSTGILIGHDFGGDHEGVEAAVRRTLTWWVRGPGSLWFVPKTWAKIKP